MASCVIRTVIWLGLMLLSVDSIGKKLNCVKKLDKCILLSGSKHAVVNCRKIATSSNGISLETLLYRCDCKYSIQQKIDASQFSRLEIECLNKTDILVPDCVEIHTGMAVRGFNLIYHKWTNKDDCFNQCLNVRIENGFNFDCQSFEHWHTDCPYDNFSHSSNISCSSLSIESGKNKAFDLCVLSNKTIKSALGFFAPNYGVTYYEVLCNGKTSNQLTKLFGK
jgi:hypothetical protein